jgi:tRNA G18 (ribose-2'-O)-methylase SpoU
LSGTRRRDTERVTPIIRVEDPDDPRLADYVRLRDVSLRRSLEAAHGLFLAEGEKVIRRAVAAGYPLRSLLMTEQHVAGLTDLLERCTAPAYVASDEVVERLTGFAGACPCRASRR